MGTKAGRKAVKDAPAFARKLAVAGGSGEDKRLWLDHPSVCRRIPPPEFQTRLRVKFRVCTGGEDFAFDFLKPPEHPRFGHHRIRKNPAPARFSLNPRPSKKFTVSSEEKAVKLLKTLRCRNMGNQFFRRAAVICTLPVMRSFFPVMPLRSMR